MTTDSAGLQPGHLPALHRATRGYGRLVADQPPAQTDQDRRTRCAPCPRHHLPAGRGRRNWPDGARHYRRHPPIASATAMRMIAIRTQIKRKRQDRSVRHAEKRHCRPGTLRVHGPIRPTSGVCATTETAQGEKHLFDWQNQAILKSDGRPLGECRRSGIRRILRLGLTAGAVL